MPGNILLVDDNKLVVKITSAILSDAGYAVSVAWDGLEAIKKAYTERPDLIILDIEMPKINGYQVCRLLKDDEFTKDIPIMMLTGREQPSDVFWGMKTGADLYITKGFKPDQLLTAIREQIEISQDGRAGERAKEIPAELIDEAGVFSRVLDLLDSSLFESTILNELGALTRVTTDQRETARSILEILAGVVGNSVGQVLALNQEEIVVHLNRPTTGEDLEEIKSRAFQIAEEYGREVGGAPGFEVVIFGEEKLRERVEQAPLRDYSHVHIPLTAQKQVVGVLVLSHYASPVFARDAQAILKLVQNQVAIVFDNARLYEAARRLAITDGLTDLYNHRFFHELFEKEYKRSDRYNTVFSLIMLDIDNFKKVNDTCGHLCGDEILKGLASLIKDCLRSIDIVGRYGGEEFAILLPETTGQEAVQTAERIRRSVEEHTFIGNGKGLRITVSQGVATYPSPGVQERFDVIAKADKALYGAKETGRNRVVFRE